MDVTAVVAVIAADVVVDAADVVVVCVFVVVVYCSSSKVRVLYRLPVTSYRHYGCPAS